jgi:hypothetical protein
LTGTPPILSWIVSLGRRMNSSAEMGNEAKKNKVLKKIERKHLIGVIST